MCLMRGLGIGDLVRLELNTLGDAESRAAYREALVAYFGGREGELSRESRERLSRNPLRILDSKDEGDRAAIADAPALGDHLNDPSRDFLARVREGLDALGIPYELNPRLVRGLDYYCHTAFEFTTDALGAQGAVIAGGRYDGLVGMMGGPPTPGVGWAGGVERLVMLVRDYPESERPVAMVPVGAAAELRAMTLADDLRRAGVAVDLGYSGNLRRRMQRADRIRARAAVLLGDDELARGVATIRDMTSGEQREVALHRLAEALRA